MIMIIDKILTRLIFHYIVSWRWMCGCTLDFSKKKFYASSLFYTLSQCNKFLRIDRICVWNRWIFRWLSTRILLAWLYDSKWKHYNCLI